MAGDLAAFGAPQEISESLEPDSGLFAIWPENVETVSLFLRLQTQWVIGAMGGFVGLNYPSVLAVLDFLKVENRAEVFEGLQVMERAALAVLNARKD